MALNPRDIVTDLSDQAHRPDSRPPALLSRPVRTDPPPTPLRQGPEVTAMHDAWARLNAGPGPEPGGAGEDPRSLRTRLDWTRLDRATGALLGRVQHRDRALVGSVIQALDAVARRCDELGDRLGELEQLLGEVVDVLGADLTHIRARLDAFPAGDQGRGNQGTAGRPEAGQPDG